MISFCIGIVALVLGYFIYGKFIEKIFGIDANRTTPAYTKQDGVDYIPMKPWRIFLIQFLNIAGVGPICGAIMGAKFGTASYLWIVLGSIFAGAVHDFTCPKTGKKYMVMKLVGLRIWPAAMMVNYTNLEYYKNPKIQRKKIKYFFFFMISILSFFSFLFI